MLKCGGELKVIRRPSEDLSYRQFVPCTHCLGFVQRRELWRHAARCRLNDKHPGEDESKKYSKLQFESEMLLYGSKDDTHSSAFKQSVISVLRQDMISFVAKRDTLILKFGHALFEKDGSARATYITQKMRSLARLLIEVRKVASKDSADMSGVISPTHFDHIALATRNLCSYNPSTQDEHMASFRKPSLAVKLGHTLNKGAMILHGMVCGKKTLT